MDLNKYKAKPNESIREHTDILLDNLNTLKDLGYIRDDKIFNLSKKACEYHDYGKANREFQNRITNGNRFDGAIEVYHNILSVFFINPNEFDTREDYLKVVFAVLNHHNYCNNKEAIKDTEVRKLSYELLDEFDIYKIKGARSLREISQYSEDMEGALIKGFLNKCDYSASAHLEIEYINNFLVDCMNNLLNRWKSVNGLASWNDMQSFCLDNTDNNIMVIAQTGMGKTEGGLLWLGDNKGFFILPLKTAINSIYKRVVENILIDKDITNKIALLHSDSLEYYSMNNRMNYDSNMYYKESRGLALPLNISTLDQIFDFVFKCPGYELKLSTLSYSKIVIDEIQMYSADLLAYLIYGIGEIIKCGGKVAILTATLAPFVKDLIEEETGVEFKKGIFTNDLKRHSIKTIDSEIDVEFICKTFLDNELLGKSNKTLIVCNTVKKAQEIYRELNKQLVGIDINLLHSKFIKRDRNKKEKEILEFGRTETSGSGIWISTQIVEASLDIDFDYLFTELSDINGLFQRLGRCNRKGVKEVDGYNCYVFLKINKNLLTNGDRGFIDSKIYNLSYKALLNIDGILGEADKLSLIENTLTKEAILGSDYYEKYMSFLNWVKSLKVYELDKHQAKLRDIISYSVIPKPIYIKYKKEIDNLSNELSDSIDSLRRITLLETIKSYTVSVGRHDIEFKGKSLVSGSIRIGRYENIDIIECEYSSNIGFIRSSCELKEEVFDGYM